MAKVDERNLQSTPFKDISLTFTRHPVTDDSGVFENEDAIKRAVTNLVRQELVNVFITTYWVVLLKILSLNRQIPIMLKF